MGAQGVEAFGQVFVAAVYGVDVAQDAHTFGGKHADEQQAGRAQGGRANNIGGAKFSGAVYVNAVGVGQLDINANFCHFGVVDGAVFVCPVVDERAALGDGDNWDEVGQVVLVEA